MGEIKIDKNFDKQNLSFTFAPFCYNNSFFNRNTQGDFNSNGRFRVN